MIKVAISIRLLCGLIPMMLISVSSIFGQNQSKEFLYLRSDGQITDSVQLESSDKIDSIVSHWILEAQTRGYLMADVISLDRDSLVAEIEKGSLYHIRRGEKSIAVNEVIDSLKEVQYNAIAEGYPFSRISITSPEIMDTLVTLDFDLDTSTFVPIVEIILDGTTRVSSQYFLNLTELNIGQPFSASRLQDAEQKIEDTKFLNLHRTEVDFDQRGAIITFYLDRQGISNFDFLLGLISPDDGLTYDIIGNVKLLLANQLGKGENIVLRFEKLQSKNQKLFASFNFPFIGEFPIGPEAFIDLNQQDSIRTRSRYGGGLNYTLSRKWVVSGFVTQENFTLSELDLDYIQQNEKLPDDLDYSLLRFTTRARANYLDYDFNPRSGWTALIDFSSGQRAVKENSSIYELDWSADSIQLLYADKSPELQFEINLSTRYFIPVFSRSTIMLGTDGGYKYSEGQILVNQLYRLGGFSSLRGFNEETIFATQYIRTIGEFRFLLDKNSNLYFFSEYSWLKNPYRLNEKDFQTIAGGFGLNFETKIGTFGIAFANGFFSGQRLNFRDSKVHFGLQSRF